MNRRQFLQAGTGALIGPMMLCAKTLNLKITGLKTFVVNIDSVNWVFFKVYTNQGLVGLGEGSVTSKEGAVSQAIMENERFLLGKDPTNIEILPQAK